MKPGLRQAEFVTIGIGLNVNSEITDFPLALRSRTTSLRCECHKTFALDSLLQKILSEFAVYEEIFYREGLAGSIAALINRNFYLADREIVVNSGAEKIKCRAQAIDASGLLVATTSDNRKISFNSGEAWLVKDQQEL
jgi:biotin-(acetyl-CoA carboxylase) ligase